MSELSDESREVLAEGPLDEATPEELEATRQRVYAALGVAAPPPGADLGAPAPLPAAASSAGIIKGVAGAAVIAAAIGGAVLVQRSRDIPAPPVAVSAPPQAQSGEAPVAAPPAPPPAPVEIAPPEPAPSPAPPRRVESPAPSSVASAAPTTAEEGALMVAAAEAQLRAGQPAAALSLYDRYLREHPKGVLRQESEAGRILALCAMGQKAAGASELERFEARHAGAPSLPRLRRACGSDP